MGFYLTFVFDTILLSFLLLSIHSIQLDQSRALKVKNTLSQALYECVFQYIVDIVNRNGLDASSSASSALLRTNLLDIAGFGKFQHFQP